MWNHTHPNRLFRKTLEAVRIENRQQLGTDRCVIFTAAVKVTAAHKPIAIDDVQLRLVNRIIHWSNLGCSFYKLSVCQTQNQSSSDLIWVDDSCMFPHTFAARTSGPCVSKHLRPGQTTRTFSRPKYSGPMHYVNQEVTVQVLSLRYATTFDLHTCHDSSALGLVHSTVTTHLSSKIPLSPT